MISSDEQIIQQLGSVDDIPPLPTLAGQIINCCFDDQINYRKMAELIRQDPVLTGRLLTLVNAPGISPPAPIDDLGHAISLLGKKQVRNLALSVTLFDSFSPAGRDQEKIMVAFRRHCVACAHACEDLARRLNFPHPEEAFIAALLHDIGKLLNAYRFGSKFDLFLNQLRQEAPVQEWPPLNLEKEIFGAGHQLLGKWAAESWNFPAAICQAVWLHHQPPLGARDTPPSLPVLVRFADAVCNLYGLGANYFINDQLDFSTSAPYARTADNLTAFFRLQRDDIIEVFQYADQRLKELESCLGPVDNELYFDAIRKANRELGRLNLERENTLNELALKNRLFEALSSIDQLLEPKNRSSPEQLLQGLVEASTEFCGGSLVLCALKNDDQEASWLGQLNKKFFGHRELLEDRLDQDNQFENRRLARALQTLKKLISQKSRALLRNNRITPLKEYPAILVVPLSPEADLEERTIHGQLVLDCSRMIKNGLKKELLFTSLRRYASTIADLLERRYLTNRLAGQAEAITELNRQNEEVQNELQQAHRLATVGRLAAGAAHEINNPLTVISGQLQMIGKIAERDQLNPEIGQRCQKVMGKIDQISRIVSDLLAYGRPQKASRRPVEVAEVLHRAMEALAHRKGFTKIRFSINLPEKLPPALVDPQHLGQIFVNLLLNAQLAIDNQGSIGISARHDENRIIINLSDTGCGIPPEHLPTIFDPFFTTRDPDLGTGLGLSIVHSLIDANRGSIEVKSIVNKGTTFIISLPRAQNKTP